jgi:hypothetical protein
MDARALRFLFSADQASLIQEPGLYRRGQSLEKGGKGRHSMRELQLRSMRWSLLSGGRLHQLFPSQLRNPTPIQLIFRFLQCLPHNWAAGQA